MKNNTKIQTTYSLERHEIKSVLIFCRTTSNNAGSELVQWSRPFFVENTPAVEGTVWNGRTWAHNMLYQPYNDRVGHIANLVVNWIITLLFV